MRTDKDLKITLRKSELFAELTKLWYCEWESFLIMSTQDSRMLDHKLSHFVEI